MRYMYMSKGRSTIAIVQPTQDEIAKKAYNYYLTRVRNNLTGTAEQDWLKAVEELTQEKNPILTAFRVK